MQPPPGGWPPPPPQGPPGYPPPQGYPPQQQQQGYGPPPGYAQQQQGYGPPPQQGWPQQGYAMAQVPAAPMFQCPMCRATDVPLQRDKISAVGWIIFAVLLLCCFPLCFIGLTQKENYRVCARCNHNLGKIG